MGKHQNVASLDALANNRNVQITDYASIVFGDSGVAKEVAVLPAGAVILGYLIQIDTAFNASTTDYLDIGNGTTADAYLADFDAASAAGVYSAAVTTKTRLTADTLIYATYTGSGTAPSAGAMKVALEWVPWGSRDE